MRLLVCDVCICACALDCCVHVHLTAVGRAASDYDLSPYQAGSMSQLDATPAEANSFLQPSTAQFPFGFGLVRARHPFCLCLLVALFGLLRLPHPSPSRESCLALCETLTSVTLARMDVLDLLELYDVQLHAGLCRPHVAGGANSRGYDQRHCISNQHWHSRWSRHPRSVLQYRREPFRAVPQDACWVREDL